MLGPFLAKRSYDVIWHLTLGVVRYPSFIYRLNRPFVLGPLGGGERAPWPMRRDYSFFGHVLDIVRDLANVFVSRLDPISHRLFKSARLVLVKTPQSGRLVAARGAVNTLARLEIGISEVGLPRPKRLLDAPRLLFVGRFLYWKGITLVVRAFAEYVRLGGKGQLTMLGRGPEKARAIRLANALNISERITWISWIEQSKLATIYDDHDLLLFPSLHDSSGNVVLEALARGLPVACLNLGGPGEIATRATGVLLDTDGLDAHSAARELGRHITALLEDPAALEAASHAAIERAKSFLWLSRIKQIAGDVEHSLGKNSLTWPR
jgi:glycosyltransferase involved in cell wall biosynthesis